MFCEFFTVQIINTKDDRFCGLPLRSGDKHRAKDGGGAGRYLVLVKGHWVSIDADNAFVVK